MTSKRLAGRTDAALGWAFAAAEAGRSRRAVSLAVVAACGLLAASTWLRPALSPDINGSHLPLRFTATTPFDADEFLHGPRHARIISPGTVVLAVVGLAAAVVAWRPRLLPTACGAILAVAVAGNAVVALNYPALIERLDDEYGQWAQIAGPFDYRQNQEDAMPARENARVGTWAALTGDEQRGDPIRGWTYLVYGWWLAALAAGVILVVDPRPLPGRFVRLAGWAALGVALATAACGPRIRGEVEWREAVRLDGCGDVDGAAAALERSAARFPELGTLERAWLLSGKLDHQRGRATPAADTFLAYQHLRDKRRPRAVQYATDLPWLIHEVNDFREALVSPPAGFDLGLDAGGIGNMTYGRRTDADRAGTSKPGEIAYQNRPRELLTARHLSAAVAASPAGGAGTAGRRLAVRTLSDIGMELYLSYTVEKSDGRVMLPTSRATMTAQDLWAEAGRFDGGRFDAAYYLGVCESFTGGADPARVLARFAPVLARSADKAVRADALCEVGDAFLRAGRPVEAHRFYVESYDLFNIPEQHKNYRAQRRLGGL